MSTALSIVIGVVVGCLAAAASLFLTRLRAELVARRRVALATLLYWVGLVLVAAALLLLRPLGRESLWAGALALLLSRTLVLAALRRSEASLVTQHATLATQRDAHEPERRR